MAKHFADKIVQFRPALLQKLGRLYSSALRYSQDSSLLRFHNRFIGGLHRLVKRHAQIRRVEFLFIGYRLGKTSEKLRQDNT